AGVDSDNWYAVFAGKSVPAAEIEKVSAALRTTLADEGVRSRLLASGAEPAASTPAELSALLKKDGDKWGRIVKAKNIKPD
ncbi:MAG: tripartite tricarboxylate transporter substrate binding protein, partial [Proteobacteria bacterium]